MDAGSIGTWLGVAISVAGFSIAIAQIRKTKNAVEAGNEAREQTELRMIRDRLRLLIANLTQCDADLSAHFMAQRTGEAVQAFTRWRHTASEVANIAGRVVPQSDSFRGTIAVAILLVSPAEQVLVEEGKTSEESVRKARAAIAQATAEANALWLDP